MQYIKKLNRQERVVEEVKIVLRPHFRRKYITKDDYKEIMRKSVSKVCIQMKGIGRVCHNIIVFFCRFATVVLER